MSRRRSATHEASPAMPARKAKTDTSAADPSRQPGAKQVVIENPILNSPFEEPRRHYQFDEDGITDMIVESRRPSSYFVPIAAPRKRTKQLTFDTLWTQDRAKENAHINFIRRQVSLWRDQGYPNITPVTRGLLDYWQRKDRERRLFFCQVEALETLIYLAEAAEKSGGAGILNQLRDDLEAAWTPLFRQACKMATGSGKTVVMAMIVAWHTLNNHQLPCLQGEGTGRRGEADEGHPVAGGPFGLSRNPGPDGPARLPGTGHEEEHRRAQRRGPPLLPVQAR
jgi:hypothetical protein